MRAADKKQGTPEHMEKVVLFLADASALASPAADAKDWEAEAASATAAEEAAVAAVKAAWHTARDARQVSNHAEDTNVH